MQWAYPWPVRSSWLPAASHMNLTLHPPPRATVIWTPFTTEQALSLVFGVLAPARRLMSLWADLQHGTSHPYGVFRDRSETEIIVLLQELRAHSNMRYTPQGHSAQQTIRGIFERSFRDHFDLSGEQYRCITAIFDRCSLSDIPAALGAAIPPTPVGARPNYTRRCFVADEDKCCGLTLRARYISATVYERNDCYPAWNMVKQCRYGCGTRYHFDRRILLGTRGGRPCSWHVFRPWTAGIIPSYVASKSGHAIISTSLLRDTAITQATNRCARDVTTFRLVVCGARVCE